jgi:hypothetical protein
MTLFILIDFEKIVVAFIVEIFVRFVFHKIMRIGNLYLSAK